MTVSEHFVSVVIPSQNMAKRIVPAIEAVAATLSENYAFYEVVIVDDGSVDGTAQTIAPLFKTHEGLRLISLSKPHGVDVAISAGVDTAIGDFVVLFDPVSDPPEAIPELVSRSEKIGGIHYGVVRRSAFAELPIWPGNVMSAVFRWYTRRYLGIDIQRGAALLRVFDRAAVNSFVQLRDRQRPLRLMSAHLGQPLHPYFYQVRGVSPFSRENLSVFDKINLAFDILAASSTHPLRWVSRLGVVGALLNVFYALYVVAIYFFKAHVAEGWVTISAQNAGMFFLLFVLLAVLSEYVGKLLVETQDRPRYTVLDERNSSVLVDPTKRRNIATESLKEHESE